MKQRNIYTKIKKGGWYYKYAADALWDSHEKKISKIIFRKSEIRLTAIIFTSQ